MNTRDKPPLDGWPFPFKMSPYLYSRHVAKKLLNKHAYVGFAYVNKNGKIYKRETFHGLVVAANLKDGLQVWEGNLGKTKKLPPDMRAWKRAQKGVYRDKLSGEVIHDVDYLSTWLVMNGRHLSPEIANERLVSRTSGTYSVYGFGTRMFGRANKQDDGSFTTTKWLTLLYFPVWPLGTYRIANRKSSLTFGLGFNGSHNADPLFLDVRQVIVTYLIWLPLLGLFILAIAGKLG